MLKRAALISVVTASALFATLPALSGKISRISANGLSVDKIMSATGIHEGDSYSIPALQAAQRTIEMSLKQAGYIDAKVSVDAKPYDNGVKVNFKIDKGDPIKIKKVTFIGNSKLNSSILESSIVNKKGGMFSFLTGGGEAMPSQIEADQARVRDEYLKRGYLDVQVSKPLMKTDFSSKSAEVTFNIKHEGEQFSVSNIEVTAIPGVDVTEVSKDFELKEGRVFNVDSLRHDLNLLVEKAGDNGYAFAKAQPQFQKNDAGRTIAVRYSVNLGPKIRVNDVKISGNTKTKNNVIRRYIYLAPGDQFNLTDLKDSKEELQRTGYFDSVEIVPKKVGGTSIDLDVKVREGQTGSVSAGLSYGSYDGLGINASISDRNMLGTGIGYSVQLEKTKKSHNYAISLTDPRVFDSLFSLSVGVYDQDYEFIDYTKEEKGVFLSFGRKLTRHLSANIGYTYSKVDYAGYETYNVDYESYKKSALTGSIVFDNTDDYLTPRKGIYANLSLEYAGLTGSIEDKYANYLKTEFKLAAYHGMKDTLGYDLILRYKLRVGNISDKGLTPRAERLFLGGSSWGVRGYSPASISPYNLDGDRVGGFKSMVNTVEASVPLSFISNSMRLTAFADYGMIGDKSIDEITRASVGAQIEWKSPFGPVNLIFAKPLKKKEGDRTAKFEFTIGSKF